jgi:cytochrome c oxidase cbb3-type subunit III
MQPAVKLFPSRKMKKIRMFAAMRGSLQFLASRSKLALLALGLASSFSPALAGDHTTKPTGEIRPAVIYHNYCSVCHGDKGDGKSRAQGSLMPPPRNFTTPEAAVDLTRERMISAVRDGKSGTAMIGWKTQLSQREIEAVVDYVRVNFMPPSTLGDANRGRMVYAKNCAVCHGDKGDGKSRAQNSLMPPPRDFTAPGLTTELTPQRMLASVTYGRPETAMVGFKSQLSKEDINAVIDYIRTAFMKVGNTEGISGIQHGRRPIGATVGNVQNGAAAAAAPNSIKPVAANMALPLPDGLKGDATKGGAFYMSNCATCHGNTGDGRGPRAYFINPKPRNFLHPASRADLNRPALFTAISAGKLGTEMPAWNKVLTPQEIANVAEFVFQRFIQPNGTSAKQGKAAAK